jgi:hypothetical protein
MRKPKKKKLAHDGFLLAFWLWLWYKMQKDEWIKKNIKKKKKELAQDWILANSLQLKAHNLGKSWEYK